MQYGSLNHQQEAAMAAADPAAWAAYVAPWWGIQMLLFGQPAIDALWPCATRTLQRAIWAWAPHTLRAQIKHARTAQQQELPYV